MLDVLPIEGRASAAVVAGNAATADGGAVLSSLRHQIPPPRTNSRKVVVSAAVLQRRVPRYQSQRLLMGSLGDGGATLAASAFGSSAGETADPIGRVNRYPAPASGGEEASASSACSAKRYPCPGMVEMAS